MSKTSKTNESLKMSPYGIHSYDPRVSYLVMTLVFGFSAYALASWAVDSGSIPVYVVGFIALYFCLKSAYKAVRAIIRKEHLVRPTGKRKKA